MVTKRCDNVVLARACFALAVAALVTILAPACGTDALDAGDGAAGGGMRPQSGGGGGAPGSGGLSGEQAGGIGGDPGGAGGEAAGGQPTGLDRCRYKGPVGGADFITCETVAVSFDPPLEARYMVEVTTDLNQPVELMNPACSQSPCETSSVFLNLMNANAPVVDEALPTMLTVRIKDADEVVEEKTFTQLVYACNHRTSDDWCWEATPLVFKHGR